MNIIDTSLINEESFVEECVTHVELNINNKIMTIEIDGGCLETSKYLLKAKIVIEDWYQLDIIERDTNKKLPVDYKNSKKFITSVMEFHNNENELRLVDLSANGWVDWIFIKPKVTVYGEIDPNPPKF